MSQNLFHHANFSDARIWALLTQLDAAEAERGRAAGCPDCGGKLHSATDPRKPRGLAAELGDNIRRFSLCCADCRHRLTPQSARFFGRRFRVAPLFVLACVLVLRGGFRLSTVSRRLNIPVRTLRRWQLWWREVFPGTKAWKWKQGDLMVPTGEAPLLVLLQRIRGRRFRSRLLRGLTWLMPWTGYCNFGDGRKKSAENGPVMV